MKEPITADRFRARASNEILPSRSPRVPPQTMFGPESLGPPAGKWIPKSFETARPFEANTAYAPGKYPAFIRGTKTWRVKDTRKTTPHRGAGSVFVQERPPGYASPRAQNADRAPSESAMRSALPATRQAAGVPSAWSQPSQSTHARPRRWCDAGPLGRHSVTADQKAGNEEHRIPRARRPGGAPRTTAFL
jgi:hypothetical protein